MHAYGKLENSNGETFEGEFNHGIRQGYGVQTFPDGRRYEGQYKDNYKHGITLLH